MLMTYPGDVDRAGSDVDIHEVVSYTTLYMALLLVYHYTSTCRDMFNHHHADSNPSFQGDSTYGKKGVSRNDIGTSNLLPIIMDNCGIVYILHGNYKNMLTRHSFIYLESFC